MASPCICRSQVVLLALITVFLHLPQFASGLHSPTNVKAQVENHGKFLIISWDYQAGANYSTIHVRNYLRMPSISGHSTVTAGPTQDAPCNSSSCSYCFSNSNYPNISCYAFNPVYKFSVGTEFDFDQLLSYKVGACSSNDSSSCIESAWKNFTIPPGEFSDYTLHKKMCLDHNDLISITNNISLEVCGEKCNNDTSCNSLEYGHGYNGNGVFQDVLFFKELGQCKLRREYTGSQKLKSCVYNYYKKKNPSTEPPTTTPTKGSVEVIVPLTLLLSLSVVISALI